MLQLTLPTVTAAALVDSINPCAISVLLLTIGFLMSLSVSRKRILLVAGVYILGIFLVYILIGLGILQALTLFGIPKVVSKIGALLIILSGATTLLGQMFPSFPIKLVIPNIAKPRIATLLHAATVPALFAMGVLVGLFEFPCTGGPYLAILALLHDHATRVSGALYLLYYNLIFVSPLVAILLVAQSAQVTERLEHWRKRVGRRMDTCSAIAMILLGFVILYMSA